MDSVNNFDTLELVEVKTHKDTRNNLFVDLCWKNDSECGIVTVWFTGEEWRRKSCCNEAIETAIFSMWFNNMVESTDHRNFVRETSTII